MLTRTLSLVMATAAALTVAATVNAGSITTSPSDFAVLTGGNLTTDSNVTIGGLIGGGVVQLGYGTQVSGGAYSRGSLQAAQNATVNGPVLAGGDVYLNQGVSVGSLSGLTSVGLANGATVNGQLYAGTTIGLNDNSQVRGNMSYGTSYWASSSARVTGAIGRNSFAPDTWSVMGTPTHTFAATPSTSNYYAANSTATLAPNTYGNLNVSQGSTIHLSAGTYDFNQVWLGAGTHVLVDTSAGNVTLNVSTSLSTDTSVLFQCLGAGALILNAHDAVYLGSGTQVDGSIYSYGTLNAASGSLIDGQVYGATSVYLASGVTVTGDALPVIPEPATMALLGLGLAPLVLLRRQARRAVVIGA